MNPAFLQRADRLLGAPASVVLTAFRRLLGPLRGFRADGTRGRRAGQPARLLLVKLAEQGATVLAVPAIRRAIERFGRDHVYMLVFEENRPILDALAVLPDENIITVPMKGSVAFAAAMTMALRRCRALRFDAAIDMEFMSRGSAAITYLTGARRRVGFHSFFGEGPYRGDLMTHRLRYSPHLHASQIFSLMVEALECDPARLPTMDAPPPPPSSDVPAWTPAVGQREAVAALIPAPLRDARPLILLNPNAGDMLPLRRWPEERYVELARRLLQQFPASAVCFTGAPAEAERTGTLASEVGSDRCVSLAGRTSFADLLTLYTLADVLVTNDSGPAHFAALSQIRVVTLFGPETPKVFGSISNRNTAMWAGLACSPCISALNNRMSTCRDNACMRAIAVEDVFLETCRACGAIAPDASAPPQ